MTSTDQPSKQEAFLTFLQDGWVTIYVDARHSGVAVPEHLKGESRLVLQYGLNMPVPVEDLEVTDAGVKATLSFSRQPYDTLIPWAAIYVIACTDGRGVLYKEDVPAELLAETTPSTYTNEGDESGGDTPPPMMASGNRGAAAHARVFQSSDDDGEAAADKAKPKPRRRLKSVPMPSTREQGEQSPPADQTAADSEPPRANSELPRSPEGPPRPDGQPDPDEPPKGGRPKLRLVK